MRFPVLALLSLVICSPALAEESVFIFDLRGRDVEPSLTQTITGLVTVMASQTPGVKVLTGADIQDLAKLEAERQATGCDVDASCLAEIAGALGARKVITGEVGRLGRTLVVNLTLFDTERATALRRATAQAGGLEDLPRALRPALAELFGNARGPSAAPLVLGAGAGAAVLGLVAAGVASVPWLSYHSSKSALTREGQAFESRPTESGVVRMADLNAQLEADRATWNELGAPVFAVGVALTAAGVLVAGAGAAFMVAE